MTDLIESRVELPKRTRGKQSAANKLKYAEQVRRFCEFIKKTAKGLDFRMSSRGWGYRLESARMIDKSELDKAEDAINDFRKTGDLPLDICAADAKRAWFNVEELDNEDAADEAGRIVRTVKQWIAGFQPRSFWQGKPYYIQMIVEKSDLRELFLPICKRWHMPIANGGGWTDINVRAELMARFRDNLEDGQIPVILYCGDHDPGGLHISGCFRENLDQLSTAVGWTPPDNLIMDRFGLNYDFIEANKLTWIDNLQTSSKVKGKPKDLSDPRHKDHFKPYVQNYLAKYGVRKVEGNALVVVPQAGRDLCEAAILKYMVDPTLPERFMEGLQPNRDELRDAVKSALAEYLEDETN